MSSHEVVEIVTAICVEQYFEVLAPPAPKHPLPGKCGVGLLYQTVTLHLEGVACG
jgi:hypothetical protein